MRAAPAAFGALVVFIACSSTPERPPIVADVSGTNVTFSWPDGPIAALDVYRPNTPPVDDPCSSGGISPGFATRTSTSPQARRR